MPEAQKSYRVYIDEYGVPTDAETGNLILPSDLIDAAEAGRLFDENGQPMTEQQLDDRMYA